MKVSLREIDKNNFRECVNLKVADGQEKFVATNVMSIAQSKIFYPKANTFAVYAGDEMVGFVMYGYDGEEERFYLGRLMVDEKHQRKGYGRAATLEVIERLKQNDDCREIHLYCSPENIGAQKLYSSIGFEKTDETNSDGEILMRFTIKDKANRSSQI